MVCFVFTPWDEKRGKMLELVNGALGTSGVPYELH